MTTKQLSSNDVEQLRYQIFNTTDDAKFQSNLYDIVKIILMEISKSTDQRAKLMELICFINNRIKSAASINNIKLEQFIELYNDDSLSILALNFAQMYVKICFPKYDLDYRLKMLPTLISCLRESRNQPQKDFILHLILPTLQLLKVNESNRKHYELTNLTYQRQYLIEFLTLILLTPYTYKNFIRTTDSDTVRYPDGMNAADFNRVVKNDITAFVINDDLEKTKCGIVNFFLQHLFPDEEVVGAICVAHSDSRHSVVSLIDREAKLLYSRLDWEKLSILNLLLDWYIPRIRQFDPEMKVRNAKCTRTRLPASVQIKMGSLLLRSKITLPNTLINELTDAAIATILDFEKAIHVKQIEIGFAMINHICTYCHEVSDEIAEKLLNAIFIFMQKSVEQHETTLKSKVLQLVPSVLQRNGSFLLNEMSYLGQLFESLGNPTLSLELHNAFKQCLNAIAGILSSMNISNDRNISLKLEAILFQNFSKDCEDIQVTVVNFSGKIFPTTHVPSRFLLLEALGDKSEIVQEKAKEALKEIFDNDSMLNIVHDKVKLPSFVELVNHHGHLYNRILVNDPLKLIPVVEYIRLCILSMDVGIKGHLSEEMKYSKPDDFRYRIYRNLLHFANLPSTHPDYPAVRKALETYCKLVQVIYYTKNHFMSYLEEIATSSPQQLLTKEGYILQRTMNLMTFPADNEKFNRDDCASAFALLCLQINDDSGLLTHLKNLLDNLPTSFTTDSSGASSSSTSGGGTNNKSKMTSQLILHFQGNCLGFCYLIERIIESDRGLEIKEYIDEFMKKIYPLFISFVSTSNSSGNELSSILNRNNDIILDILRGLCALGRSGSLHHLELGKLSEATSTKKSTEESNMNIITKFNLIQGCLKLIKQNQVTKIREISLALLATLCFGSDDTNKDFYKIVLDKLVAMYNMKDAVIHEPIARAIVAIVLGPSRSPYFFRWFDRYSRLENELDSEIERQQKEDAKWLLDRILKLLEDGKTNAITRHNLTVWCREIVSQLGHLLIGRLPLLHSRMLVVLGDKDEIAQDYASNVLSEIHHLCSEEERKLMSEELIQVVLHGKRGKIGMDSNTFTDAELESRQKNQSTYKELCSLATELNQPSLIYSFMPLASNSANSSVTTVNAVSLLLSSKSSETNQALQSAIPKLFRYRYDPSARTQKAMSRVWSNLSENIPKGSIGLVLQSLDGIISELTIQITHGDGRIRESCCGGIVGLVQQIGGVTVDEMKVLLLRMGDLLEQLFKVMDDSREESRNAALEAANSVEKFCTNILEDASKRKSAELLLNSTNNKPIMSLLETGLSSKVTSVHEFSLRLLSAIVKSGRTIIRPMLPQLVVSCLHGLSGTAGAGGNDDTTANYISQQLAGGGHLEARDRWDTQRAGLVRQSPLWQIVSMSIRYIDEETQAAMIMPLVDVIRSGVGLSTKCGTASYLVDLACHCGDRLKGATGKLLAALLQAVLDKSEVVQREMARAIGYLVKYSKSSSVEKLFGITNSWYFDNHDSEQHQWACCYTYSSVEKHASGTIQEHWSKTIPLLFLAKQMDCDSATNWTASPDNSLVLNSSNSVAGTSGSPNIKKPPNSTNAATAASDASLKRRVIWNETWLECGGDSLLMTGTNYKAILESVLDLCVAQSTITSRYHGVRTQSALACRAMVRLCSRMDTVTAKWWASKLSGVLMECVSGAPGVKWWSGKIYLLHGVMSLVRTLDQMQAKDVIQQDTNKLMEILERETNRTDVQYRCVAIEAVGKVSDTLDCSEGVLSRYLETITSMITKAGGEQQVPVTEREILVRAIGRLWPHSSIVDEQKMYFVPVIHLLTVAMEEGQWKQQTQALKSFKSIFNKTNSETIKDILNQPDNDYSNNGIGTPSKVLKLMLKPWKKIAEMTKYKQLRESCLETIELLVKRREFHGLLWESLRGLLQSYTTDSVTTIKEKAVELLKTEIQ